MRNIPHYFPILRLKIGEMRAIAGIDERLELFYTPIFEMVHDSFWEEPKENGRRKKDANGEYLPKISKDADDVLKRIAKNLMEHCKNDKPLMIDMADLTDKINYSFSDHPMVRFFEEMRNTYNLPMIPVTGLTNNARPLIYQEAVRTCVGIDKRGLCLRVSPSDICLPDICSRIDGLLEFLGVSYSEVYLLLDLRFIDTLSDLGFYIERIPSKNEWYDIIVASGAFPKNGAPTMFKPNFSYEFPRYDWLNWENLASSMGISERLPSYSDYTTHHPEYAPFETFYKEPTAKVTWTLEDRWVMERGQSIKTKDQFPHLARALFGQDGFEESLIKGCIADDLLTQIYEGTISDQDIKGDLTSWIGYSVNRHITLTVLQLCDLFER